MCGNRNLIMKVSFSDVDHALRQAMQPKIAQKLPGKNSARKNHHRSTWREGTQKEHYTVIKEEYSRENSESQEVRQERNNSQDKQGERKEETKDVQK